MNNFLLDKIISGDCLAVLKTIDNDTFDLGITSPPYNKLQDNGYLIDTVNYTKHIDKMTEMDYQSWQVDVLNEAFRVTKDGGSFFYNHKIRMENGIMIHPMTWLSKTEWTIKQEIIWDRKLAANIRGWRFWQTDERIYWLYKPFNGKHGNIGKELLSKHASLRSIWAITPEKKNRNPHPAPFPITIPTRIIYSLFDAEQGKSVFDIFCGSGTTLLASKLLGHHYTGIENSVEYIEMANKRIDTPSEHDMKLFSEELAKHIRNKSYQDFKNEKKSIGRYEQKYKKRD